MVFNADFIRFLLQVNSELHVMEDEVFHFVLLRWWLFIGAKTVAHKDRWIVGGHKGDRRNATSDLFSTSVANVIIAMMIDFMVIPEEVLAVCFDNVSMASR